MNSANGLDLFISISLTYPELNAVRYDADHNIIGLEVAVQGKYLQMKRNLSCTVFIETWICTTNTRSLMRR